MEVKVIKVIRISPPSSNKLIAIEVVIRVGGDTEIFYQRGSGREPIEVARFKYGVQVLDEDTFYIQKTSFDRALSVACGIFNDDRETEVEQGLVEPVQKSFFGENSDDFDSAA